MRAFLSLAIGLVIYLGFFATFLYLIAFVGNLFVPKSVDIGPTVAPALAALIDIGLIVLFGLQHSIMARPAFKRWWTGFIPPELERSIYVLAATAALAILLVGWQPIPTPVIWSVEAPALVTLIWVLFGLGWAILLLSTFLINHFELFGLHQLWRYMRGLPEPKPSFVQPLFYRAVRHPLYLGFIIAFWAAPVMTLGHLLFSAGMTAYILVGIAYEERDLLTAIGTPYAEYRRKVGMLLPGIGKVRS